VRYQYYESLKQLARSVRLENGLDGPRVLKSDLKRIYKNQGIRLDYRPYASKNLRGAYFNDEYGVSVMVSDQLPNDPLIFTLAHELKHHLVDSTLGSVNCVARIQETEPIEIGAEVFAAEFLFPEQIFIEFMGQMGLCKGQQCTRENLVQIKHDTKTTLSYAGLIKKAEWLGFAEKGSLPRDGWKRLEEQIYGVPFYKRRYLVGRT